jgi:hypothetical protein
MIDRIVNAPWAYGATLPWTVTVLNILLGTIVVFCWPVAPHGARGR